MVFMRQELEITNLTCISSMMPLHKQVCSYKASLSIVQIIIIYVKLSEEFPSHL